MPLPNLIHPIAITIEQISKSTTIYDTQAREPVQQASRKTAVVVAGQPKWNIGTDFEMTELGAIINAQGYVLFRVTDLASKNVEISIGDRITRIGRDPQDVYIVRLQPMGHYTDQDGASLVRAWFSDRNPSKER